MDGDHHAVEPVRLRRVLLQVVEERGAQGQLRAGAGGGQPLGQQRQGVLDARPLHGQDEVPGAAGVVRPQGLPERGQLELLLGSGFRAGQRAQQTGARDGAEHLVQRPGLQAHCVGELGAAARAAGELVGDTQGGDRVQRPGQEHAAHRVDHHLRGVTCTGRGIADVRGGCQGSAGGNGGVDVG